MAIVKVTNSKAGIGKAINYVTQEEKTEEKLISGINCTPETALDEMNATKEQFRKTEGRQYAHYVHSFKPGENIDHEQAHKLALELSEKQFKGYEVLVATHKDKNHIHSHIIVNSVSYEDGRKLHSSKKDLAEVKELSNKICEREGLSITEPQKDALTSFNAKKYKSLEKGVEGGYKSYMLDLWKDVNSSMKKATSKEQFIQSMNQKGYEVKWSDSRKYITYVPPKGRPIRDSNLAETFKNEKLSKEGLLNEFNRNRERFREQGNNISRDERERSHGEQGATSPSGINNSANKITRAEVEQSIFFGQGTSKVYGVRDDKSFSLDKTEQRETGQVNRAISDREENTRGEQKATSRENKQDNSRVTTGNESIKRNELSEDRRINQSSTEVTRDNTRDIHEISGDITRSQQHGESDNMERESKTILHSTGSNDRIDIDDSRSLSSDNLLDKIVSRFDEPLKKLEEKEKEKKELAEIEAKAREERKLKLEPKPIRTQSRDLGPEL